MKIEAIFKFIAYTVPAIIVLGGILLMFTGYIIGKYDMVGGGVLLVLFGAFLYALEIRYGS